MADYNIISSGSDLNVCLSNIVVYGKKNNYMATIPPTVTNDSSEGYGVGSLWIDNTGSEAYRCLDATVGAAVWDNATLTADELGTVAMSGDYNDLINKPTLATAFTTLPELNAILTDADLYSKTETNNLIAQTINFVDLIDFNYTQGQNYKITSVTPEPGVTATINLGGTSTAYILGDTVAAWDVLDISVDVAGAITIKGTLI